VLTVVDPPPLPPRSLPAAPPPPLPVVDDAPVDVFAVLEDGPPIAAPPVPGPVACVDVVVGEDDVEDGAEVPPPPPSAGSTVQSYTHANGVSEAAARRRAGASRRIVTVRTVAR
jgi:hypothetical protein